MSPPASASSFLPTALGRRWVRARSAICWRLAKKAELDWVRTRRGHDGNRVCYPLGRERCGAARCHYYVNLGGNKFSGQTLKSAHLSVCPSLLKDDILPFHVPQLA